MEELLTANPNSTFDQFIKDSGKAFIYASGAFHDRIKQSNFTYGRFVIPTYLKANLLTEVQEKLVNDTTAAFVKILNKTVDLYFTDPAVKDAFRLDEKSRELLELDPGFKDPIRVARFDAFLSDKGLHFIELNSGSPAGMAYADILDEEILATPELKEYFDETPLNRIMRCSRLFEALIKAYRDFGGTEKSPQIVIADWKTVRTMAEFERIKTVFEEKGSPTKIVDPRDLKLKNGQLFADDFRVDIIYRRFIFSELLEKLDETKDMLDACRKKIVCLVNPLRSVLAGTKTVMSILTDPGFDRLFTDEENRIKALHLPWTRRVSDAIRFYGGRQVYLVDFLKDEKDTLVLKPIEAYGGKDVYIGAETSDSEWNKVIDQALKNDWVIQEKLNIPTLSMPLIQSDHLQMVAKKASLSTFSFGGTYAGSFARVSDESVITVARAGGLISCIGAKGSKSK